MNYTEKSLRFRVRKVARYLRLYGPRRTYMKVRGQYHMTKHFPSLPPPRRRPSAAGHVAIIGCGNFAFSNIAYYLRKNFGTCIRAAMDTNIHRAASLFSEFDLTYYTSDATEIMADPKIDLVYIASNHASHAEYAIQAMTAGKAVHIEKPHVVDRDQLRRLIETASQHSGRIQLGFNRPKSPIGKLIATHLRTQSGPAMLNWFIAGHEIDPDHWYFHEKEGGRILGNLCHWTDLSLQMIPPAERYPLRIVPARAARSDCDVAVSYVFGDGSIAAITFSAKGHTFEGVREKFAGHRGNVLISMDDFKVLVVEIVEKRIRFKHWFRNHGHEQAIRRSYQMSKLGGDRQGLGLTEIQATAELFLATRDALEQQRPMLLDGPGATAVPALLPSTD